MIKNNDLHKLCCQKCKITLVTADKYHHEIAFYNAICRKCDEPMIIKCPKNCLGRAKK